MVDTWTVSLIMPWLVEELDYVTDSAVVDVVCRDLHVRNRSFYMHTLCG